MSNVTTLRSTFDRTAWKSAFAKTLMRLRPDMNPDAADEVSDSEFPPNKALDPVFVASHWAEDHGPVPTDPSVSKSA